MIDINIWMENYKYKVLNIYKERVLFIGLQGSYARNEANETSDIDTVLILNHIYIDDLKLYKKEVIDKMNEKKFMCGFMCGEKEIKNWCKFDLFRLYNDTISYYKDIKNLLPIITIEDAKESILVDTCNIYHICLHNYLFEKSIDILCSIYKSAFFILQAQQYFISKKYIKTHKQLNNILKDDDLLICQLSQEIKQRDIKEKEFDNYSDLILRWTSKIIRGN